MTEKKFKILIVDDIAANIQVLGSVLRKSGYEVAFTDNGPDAISKAKVINFDLILLDIMMPQMDGFEVCNILKATPESKKIPIIFLTAKSDSESLVKGFELGAVDYLTKPFKAPELLARVQTHIALKHASEELHKSNAMKDKIFSIIAHDLRGPVGNLSSVLDLLIENFETFEKSTMIDTLSELKVSASRAYELLQNLLKWARSQNKTIDFSPQNIVLKPLILKNLELIQSSASQKSIQFTTDIQDGIIVFADENMVQTILRNLFSNAIKFSHKNGLVEINSRTSGSFAEIHVKDFGVGISDENLKKLFVPHEYFSTYGTNNEKGTGIGLNICKDFVERNNGKIDVISDVNTGTTFSFTLPVAQHTYE